MPSDLRPDGRVEPMFDKPRRRRWVLVAAVAVIVLIGLLSWPSTTKLGVNFLVTELPLPLWLKAVDFVDRDRHLARLAAAMLEGVEGDEARAMTVLEWTRRNIRPRPAGLPIMDDHVWYTIVRGYGEGDQRTDVFTTLLVYESVRAYWGFIGRRPHGIPIAFVRIDDRWRVFDAANAIDFRNRDNELATPEELAADPSIVRRAAEGRVEKLDQYLEFFEAYRPPAAPDTMRGDLQMPLRRLAFEVKRLLGVEGRTWQIWPEPAGS